MTTIYTGSNYGIISTLNSGSGSISISATITKSWELVKNYTSGSVLLSLTAIGSGGWIDFQIEYSNDGLGTVTSTETHRFLQATDTTATSPLYPPSPIVLQFKPQGAYMRVVLNNLSPTAVTYNIQTRFNNSADPDTTDGVISSANSFNQTNVTISSTITGTYEDISECSLITILAVGTAGSTPSDCTLQCIFSTDGTNSDRIVNYTIQDITANGSSGAPNSLTFNPAHTLLPISRYFKIIFTNNTLVQLNTLRITTTYHNNKSKALTSRVTQALTDQFDTDTTRSILTGRTIGTLLPQGHYQNIGVQNQAIATYMKDPATAFGELLTGQLTPQIQFDYSNGEPYEVQAPIFRNDLTNTSYTYGNGMLTLTTNNVATSKIIQAYSSEYTKYKPGLGLDSRITAVFDSDNGAGINQYIGLFTPENSLTFGYFDTQGFCIRYGRGGVQQIVDITISGTATSAGTITINFGVTPVTTTSLAIGATAVQGAYAIATAINSSIGLDTYGWKAVYFKPSTISTSYTVRLVRNYSSNTPITVTVPTSPVGYTITPSTLRSGSDVSYTYYPQANWNIDTCLGLTSGTLQTRYNTNPSGFQLDPTKGNLYRIVFQYLGFGAITFYVENPETGFFMPVHQIKYANSAIQPSVTSPNYKLGYGIENSTTTNISLSAGSLSAFIQGAALPAPLYRSYPNIIITNTGNSTITKANSRVIFGFRILDTKTSLNSSIPSTITINRSNLFLNSISVALNILNPNNANPSPSANMVFQLVKNPTQFYLGDPITTIYQPDWTTYELDSNILVFNGTARTNTTTGIGYTGGLNVFDLPLVENTANTYNLQPLLINVSTEDIYIISYYGNASANVTSFDVMASLSYQVNN